MIERPSLDYEADEVQTVPVSTASHLFTGSLVVVILALFMGFIFNRYLPINEGWYYYYAWLMHKGQMPYTDFWYFSQPFDLFMAWLFAGDHLINLRIFGLVERIILSGLLYFLISRQFSPKAAFLSTLVSMMVLLTYLTESFFTFLIDSLTFLVAGLICVYLAQIHPRHHRWLLLLAGVFGSLCFWSKQSTGLLGSVVMAILIAWPGINLRRLIPKLVYFSVGWWLIGLPIVGWIAANGAWHAYILEAYKGAASSKGSLYTVFITSMERNFAPKMLAVDIVILLLFAFAVRKKYLVFRKPRIVNPTRRDIALISAIALILAFVPIYLRLHENEVLLLRQYMAVFAKAVFMAMVLLFVWLVIQRLRSRINVTGPVATILIVGGFFWGYACQMSNKVEQHAVVLGLAYLIAAACDSISSRSGKSFAGIMTVLCLCQVGESALYKYNDAYDWNGWRSVIPVHEVTSHWPQLAGFRLGPQTEHILDSILDDIQRDTKPGEPIFTFPHMPMFNFVTRHPQPTFSPVHYWDVCPDYVAVADAARVKAARPAVIVEMHMPEWLWVDGEDTFRNGHLSGQRKIEAVIQQFAASGDYRLQDTFIAPWVFTRINVWQRVR